MIIYDINGTTSEHSEKCNCGSWKNHWLIYNSPKIPWPENCPIQGCKKTELKAAHVKIVNPHDDQWYIVPLCEEHYNKKNKELIMDDNMSSFARADQNTVCKYPNLPMP